MRRRIAGSLNNRGVELLDSDPARAQRWLLSSLAVDPNHAAVWLNLGNALSNEGDVHGALGCYRRAMRLAPEYPQPRVNAGVAMIALGDPKGWELYDARFALPAFWEMNALRGGAPSKVWTGQPLEGKTILAFHEQGYGDILMGLRYSYDFLAAGARHVILRVPGPLYRIARASLRNPKFQVVTDAERLPDHDWCVPFMSLPRHFGTGSGEPYLRVYREDIRKPGPYPFPKVGLVWGGSPHHKPDKRRSMPFATMRPLLDVHRGHVCYASLQQGERAKECHLPVHQFSDYYETAVTIQDFDLIITVDTSIAHLAGAMGIPTWMLVAFNPDFRWGLEGETTPWYKSVRIFRQTKRGDWPSVIQRVQSELATFVAQHRSAA